MHNVGHDDAHRTGPLLLQPPGKHIGPVVEGLDRFFDLDPRLLAHMLVSFVQKLGYGAFGHAGARRHIPDCRFPHSSLLLCPVISLL
ncbi:hypothetical protein D3C73_1566560 [compost metagenome]